MQFTYFLDLRCLKILQLWLLLCGTLALSGCQSASFLWQAFQGQWEILSERQSIDDLLVADETPQGLKSKLRYVIKVRQFAEEKLKLPVGEAYLDYVDLHRPDVVWNLFVAPELNINSHTWCYPVAGCVAYQGYFNQAAAENAQQDWEQQGWDTYVGGIAAYSTLGWFDDPILNTFINYDRISLAALLFHELAHRRLYLPGETTFNESWATAVEQAAIEDFLETTAESIGDPMLDSALQRYRQRFQDQQVFVGLVQQSIKELEELYKQPLPDMEKRKQKATILQDLRDRYHRAVDEGRILTDYSGWIDAPLNNAKLLTVASYYQWVPGLRYQLQSMKNNYMQFYQWSEALIDLPADLREKRLQELNQQANVNTQ